MSEEESFEEKPIQPQSLESAKPIAPLIRGRTLTPEQRRFMGTPRIKDGRPESAIPEPERGLLALQEVSATEIEASDSSPGRPPNLTEEAASAQKEPEPPSPLEEPLGQRRMRSTAVESNSKSSRISEMRTPLAILAVLILLACTFYIGKKFEYWKYQFMVARSAAKLDAGEDRFPNVSADELVAQALVSERAGNYQDAVDRLIAAKHKDLAYRGILFRVGKMAYDAGDFNGAEKLFERAVAFGEDPAVANYFRGLVAIRFKDLAAAQRYFEAAANADPFTAQHHYYLAEVMRLDHHPNEAIARYERARLLAPDEQAATVCRFKIRMALLEAGKAPEVATAIERQSSEGPLPVDWLMTAAALNIRQAKVSDALPLIRDAMAADQAGVFITCLEDAFFVDAIAKFPEVAAACGKAGEPLAVLP